jgi:hypothetical protein
VDFKVEAPIPLGEKLNVRISKETERKNYNTNKVYIWIVNFSKIKDGR